MNSRYCLLGLVLLVAWTGVTPRAEDVPPENTSTINLNTPDRKVTTTESRRVYADGRVTGTFLQKVRGTDSPENLLLKGEIKKEGDLETLNLNETGVAANKEKVDNKVVVTVKLIARNRVEELVRRPARAAQNGGALADGTYCAPPVPGGLPGKVRITYQADPRERLIESWADPDGDPVRPDWSQQVSAGHMTINRDLDKFIGWFRALPHGERRAFLHANQLGGAAAGLPAGGIPSLGNLGVPTGFDPDRTSGGYHRSGSSTFQPSSPPPVETPPPQ